MQIEQFVRVYEYFSLDYIELRYAFKAMQYASLALTQVYALQI
jgi:hypothetical protein